MTVSGTCERYSILKNSGVFERVNVVSIGCARRRGIDRHLQSVIHARTGADTAPHPRISSSLSLSPSLFLSLSLSLPPSFSCSHFPPFSVSGMFFSVAIALSFSECFHSSLFLSSRTRERKNTIVYRVYMAPLYPHVRNVPCLGTAEAEPRGALSLINGISFRTYNRRPMTTNLFLFFSTLFSRLIRSLNHHRCRGPLPLYSASTTGTPFTPSLSVPPSFPFPFFPSFPLFHLLLSLSFSPCIPLFIHLQGLIIST